MATSKQDSPSKDSLDSLVARIARQQDKAGYQELHWEGSFEEYLDIVREQPAGHPHRLPAPLRHDPVARDRRSTSRTRRSSSATTSSTTRSSAASDAIYGLDVPLMKLVNVFKSAAQGYGTEKRVLLLHGPVGSSKSTIARLLKKGLEDYSRTRRGRALHLQLDASTRDDGTEQRGHACPMHEEPLHLIPLEWRAEGLRASSAPRPRRLPASAIDGDLCPFCRYVYNDLPERSTTATGPRVLERRARQPADPLARRTASASAPSSPRTRRTRTRPS